MKVIEPHIHMYSRTTDDYQAMYAAGIRACVEPSFWMGADRRYAGTFFDYYNLILEFETVRARRFGIDHFAAVSLNPKETENRKLADEVIDGLGVYLDHARCVALGEIGFNNMTVNEEYAFQRQLELAKARDMVVIVHLPHFNKPEGIRRTAAIIREAGMNPDKVLIDHNTEETMAICRDTGCYCGMTVYPISKLTPARVSGIIREFGSDRMIVDGSADWGISDPLSLVKVVAYMKDDGHPESTIEKLVFSNAMAFYRGSPKWTPELDLVPVDPTQFQR
ncbi:MAG TPA: hydrolase TatD [Verrucomicrobia bacterium]|nr:hydrolase TatD [Verrucomicrobiota bacterium]